MKVLQNNKVWKLCKVISIVLVLSILVACGGIQFIIPLRSQEAHTKDELIELYWEYRGELHEVAEIVLTSEAFLQRIIDGPRNFAEIGSVSVKDDFSEEEWERIVDLFEKIRPFRITRTRYAGGDNVIYISFPSRRVDGYFVSAYLFYFECSERAREYKRHNRFWTGDLAYLDENWYVSEHIRER